MEPICCNRQQPVKITVFLCVCARVCVCVFWTAKDVVLNSQSVSGVMKKLICIGQKKKCSTVCSTERKEECVFIQQWKRSCFVGKQLSGLIFFFFLDKYQTAQTHMCKNFHLCCTFIVFSTHYFGPSSVSLLCHDLIWGIKHQSVNAAVNYPLWVWLANGWTSHHTHQETSQTGTSNTWHSYSLPGFEQHCWISFRKDSCWINCQRNIFLFLWGRPRVCYCNQAHLSQLKQTDPGCVQLFSSKPS